MRTLRQALLLATIVTAAFSIVNRASAIPYTITDLGPAAGDDQSYGLSLNGKGQVAGWSRQSLFYDTRRKSVLWTAGIPQVVSAVPATGVQAGEYDRATGVNDAGQVVGVTSQTTGDYHWHAYLWTSAAGLHDLGTILGGHVSGANGINSKGAVVGYADTSNYSYAYHAFLWTAAAGMQDLGTLGGLQSEASAINATGQIAGWSNDATGAQVAFRWTAASGMQSLGVEPGDYVSYASSINDNGVVAGTSGSGPASHAFIWDQTHGMQDLGTLGYVFTSAYGINNLGQVVGSSMPDGYSVHAFLWDAAHGMQDLNDLVAPGSGWVLTEATAINATGQIAGTGVINGVPHGFLLTMPPPINLTLSPAVVPNTTSSTGTVTLGSAATTSPNPFDGGNIEAGVYVRLASNNAAAMLSGNAHVAPDGKTYVFVQPGQTQATFTINTGQVTASTSALITAYISGASKSVSMTINPVQVQSIVLSPSTVYNGLTSTATITLTSPALQTINPFDHSIFNGALVKLGSSKAAVTFGDNTFPGGDGFSYVYMPYGSSQVSVTINTGAVSASTVAQLTATLDSASKSANLTVTPTLVQSITLSPTTVYNGDTSTATITFNGPVTGGFDPTTGQPIGGALVKLSSSSPTVTFQAGSTGVFALSDGNTYTFIPQGMSSTTITVSTTAVTATTAAKITATLNGASKVASLTITPTQVKSLTLSPTSVYNGDATTVTLTLNGPVVGGSNPTTGEPTPMLFVKLTSNKPGVIFVGNTYTSPDGNVYGLINYGQTTATFLIYTTAVQATTATSITTAVNGTAKSAALMITSTQVKSLTLSATSVYNGGAVTGTITLNGAVVSGFDPTDGEPLAGVLVKLASSSSIGTFSGAAFTYTDGNTYVYIPAGQTTATFTIYTNAVTANKTASISASLNGVTKAASLTVTPTLIKTITLSPTSIPNGGTVTGAITLNGAVVSGFDPTDGAPLAGVLVKLASSSSVGTFGGSAFTYIDGNTYVYIPTGQTTATFTLTTSTVKANTVASISATLNGMSKAASLTVTPTLVQSIVLSPASIRSGGSSNATITLSTPAGGGFDPISGVPTSDVFVKVTSSNPAATFGASVGTLSDGNTYVLVPYGQSTASFTINAGTVTAKTTATIGAALYTSPRSAILTVSP